MDLREDWETQISEDADYPHVKMLAMDFMHKLITRLVDKRLYGEYARNVPARGLSVNTSAQLSDHKRSAQTC